MNKVFPLRLNREDSAFSPCVHCSACVSPPWHETLVPTGRCQMTEQHAVERSAPIQPCTVAARAQPGSSDEACVDMGPRDATRIPRPGACFYFPSA